MSLFLTDNRLAHLLTLDHPNSSHLVLFNDTKTYCLLRNPFFGKAPLLLERSGFCRGLSALLASAGAFGAAVLPDGGTARASLSSFASPNCNPAVSHGDPALKSVPTFWQGRDLRSSLWEKYPELWVSSHTILPSIKSLRVLQHQTPPRSPGRGQNAVPLRRKESEGLKAEDGDASWDAAA